MCKCACLVFVFAVFLQCHASECLLLVISWFYQTECRRILCFAVCVCVQQRHLCVIILNKMRFKFQFLIACRKTIVGCLRGQRTANYLNFGKCGIISWKLPEKTVDQLTKVISSEFPAKNGDNKLKIFDIIMKNERNFLIIIKISFSKQFFHKNIYSNIPIRKTCDQEQSKIMSYCHTYYIPFVFTL